MKFLKGFPVPQIFICDLRRLTMMVVVIEPEPAPPIRITPPRIIIVIGIRWIIVYRPKIDFLARNNGISIMHFTERFDLLPYNITRYGDLFPSSKNIGSRYLS